MNVAHLVPASFANANSYWFLTDFLFGTDIRKSRTRVWNETSRLMHGSSSASNGKTVERVANTGIKHMVTNKILLASQAEYFDSTPCVMIVPIMSRHEGTNWSGEAYDAIMLIDKYVDPERLYVASPLAHVAQGTGFTHYDEEKNNNLANPEEVQLAMNLFRDYTRAIYYAQKILKPAEANFSLQGDVGNAGVFYPKLPPNHEHRSVRKISFASNNSEEGHPAPDPLLLLSKSIAVLQARNGFRMMAAAETRADILPSDQSIQAEEDYLRWREQAMIHRDPLGMDILVG